MDEDIRKQILEEIDEMVKEGILRRKIVDHEEWIELIDEKEKDKETA